MKAVMLKNDSGLDGRMSEGLSAYFTDDGVGRRHRIVVFDECKCSLGRV